MISMMRRGFPDFFGYSPLPALDHLFRFSLCMIFLYFKSAKHRALNQNQINRDQKFRQTRQKMVASINIWGSNNFQDGDRVHIVIVDMVDSDWYLYDISPAVQRQNIMGWCGRSERHLTYRKSPKTCLVGTLSLLWCQRHRRSVRRMAYLKEGQYIETDPHHRWEDSRLDAQKGVANGVGVETPLAAGHHVSARRARTYYKPVIVLDKATHNPLTH